MYIDSTGVGDVVTAAVIEVYNDDVVLEEMGDLGKTTGETKVLKMVIFYKQKTADEIYYGLGGSEMCIRERVTTDQR